MTAGIREEIDLDVTAALRKVAELEAAVARASKVNLKVENSGLLSASSGVKAVATEAEKAEAHVGGLSTLLTDAKNRLGGLAGTASGQLSPALSGVKSAVSEVAAGFSGAQTAMLGVAAGGIAVLGVLGDMAIHGVSNVLKLADSVRQMQRATGATAEEASGLVAITAALGIDSASAANGYFKLSQTIAKHSDLLQADGVEIVRNSAHHVDLIKTLFSVADAYQKAGSGAEGNKIAFDAFGKSAQSLLPLLNLSRKQLEEFYADAEQHHEILSQAEVDKARAYQIATHDLSESFAGMERELGLRLIPALTGTANWLSNVLDKVDNTANAVGSFVSHHHGFFSKVFDGAQIVGTVTGVSSVVDALGWLGKGSDKSKSSLAEVSTASDKVAVATGVVAPRIKQLAESMGIDLANATAKENQALDAAAAKLNAAVTPTQRLAADTGVLTNQFSTAKENVDAFSDALDAALGVYITSDEAAIRVRTAVDSLTKAMHDGVQKGQTYQQFQDDVALKADDVSRAVEAQVQALVRDGTVSDKASAQKKALVDRFLYLAATIGGPVADKLREYAFRVGQMPDEKVTHIDADTTKATDALDSAGRVAKSKGKDAGDNFTRAIASAIDAGADALRSAGERAGLVVSGGTLASLHIKSPSQVGIQIGNYFVQGITLGIKDKETLLYDAAFAQAHGLTDVYKQAAQVTASESLTIFAALDKVRDAQTALNYVEHDRYATSEQLARAQATLAAAQEDVNKATFDALDSTDALTSAYQRQKSARDALNASLNSSLGALNAVSGLRGAKSDLAAAQAEEAAARDRAAQLPGLIASATQALASAQAQAQGVTTQEALSIVRARQSVTAAQQALGAAQASGTATADDLEQRTLELKAAQEDLAKAVADSTGPTQEVTDAERALKDLRDEQTASAKRLTDASNAVTDAELRVVSAEQSLIDAGTALTGTQDDIDTFFRSIATAAGLTRSEIDSLVDSINRARNTATSAANGTQNDLVSVPGGGQVTRSFADWFAQQPKSVQDSLVALGPGFNSGASSGGASVPNLPPGVNPGTGQYGNGVSATPGTDPNLVASIVADIGRQFGGGAPLIGTLAVEKTVDADVVIHKLAFAASGGGFSG